MADPKDLSLRQLRTELKRNNLSPSGLKAVLVSRLKESLAKEGKETVPLSNLKKKTKDASPSKRFSSVKEKYRRKTLFPLEGSPSTEIQYQGDPTLANLDSPVDETDVKVEGDQRMEVTNDGDIESEFPKFTVTTRESYPEKKKFISPFDRENELKRRRLPKRKRDDREDEEERPISRSSFTQLQAFYEQSFMEMQRIKTQRRQEMELIDLERQVESQRSILQEKDRFVTKLQEAVSERDRLIFTLNNSKLPKDLASRWTTFEGLLKLGSDAM
jgi:hypothetical protein